MGVLRHKFVELPKNGVGKELLLMFYQAEKQFWSSCSRIKLSPSFLKNKFILSIGWLRNSRSVSLYALDFVFQEKIILIRHFLLPVFHLQQLGNHDPQI
jgi:hypothetical protein